MSYKVYIGVDDTDTLDSVGTGRVAKGLAARLKELGLAQSLGVGRHQLLVDSRVKYTSHNSSKSLAVMTDRPEADLYEPAIAYMKSVFVPGSDPGLCICPENKMNDEIIKYSYSSQKIVLTKAEAYSMAAKHNIFLKELGGDGGGIIGALAAIGLRASGNDGRLVDLPGIKEIKGLISIGELKKKTPIVSVRDTSGRELADADMLDSLDWVRPNLIGNQAVLEVQPAAGPDGQKLWEAINAREKRNRKAAKAEGKNANLADD